MTKKRTRPRGGASHPCQCRRAAPTRVVDTRRARRRGKTYVLRVRRCPCDKTFCTAERVAT